RRLPRLLPERSDASGLRSGRLRAQARRHERDRRNTVRLSHHQGTGASRAADRPAHRSRRTDQGIPRRSAARAEADRVCRSGEGEVQNRDADLRTMTAAALTFRGYMNWLFKEEPTHYSFDALVEDKKKVWSGVKNPA